MNATTTHPGDSDPNPAEALRRAIAHEKRCGR